MVKRISAVILALSMVFSMGNAVYVRVPFGGTARRRLPYVPESVIQEKNNPVFRDVRDGVCMLEAGDYHISYELTQSLKKEYHMDSTWQELFSNPEIARYVKEELDMNIPRQYWKRTVNELAVTFPSETKGDRLKKLEKFLKSIVG